MLTGLVKPIEKTEKIGWLYELVDEGLTTREAVRNAIKALPRKDQTRITGLIQQYKQRQEAA